MRRREHRREPQRIEPAMFQGRVPPHNLDAEAAVLSALLLDEKGTSYDIARGILGGPGHDEGSGGAKFYAQANGLIYEGIADVRARGGRVDIVIVASWLRQRGYLAQIGGASYLAQIADATPNVRHVAEHAQVVFDEWVLRQLIARCHLTAASAYVPSESSRAILEEHTRAVHDLATVNAGAKMLPLAHGFIERLNHAWDRFKRGGGGVGGIGTGLAALDAKIGGLHDGDLYVVAARPGMGKSSLTRGMAVTIATPHPELFEPVEYGVPLFSLEMPREQLQDAMACTEGSVNLGHYRGGLLREQDWERLSRATAHLIRLPIWVDDTARITIPQIRAKVRQLEAEWVSAASGKGPPRRLGPVIIDYLQLVGTEERGRSREEEVSSISREAKALAKELKCPVVALAQLNRAVEGRVKDRRPQLSDLRDSGAIEQDADTIIFIYRDEYYNPGNEATRGVAELIVAKQRNGSTGKILASFTEHCTRFGDLDSDRAAAYLASVE